MYGFTFTDIDFFICIFFRHTTTNTTVLRRFFRDHPGEPVPEANFLDFMVQGNINRGGHTDHPGWSPLHPD